MDALYGMTIPVLITIGFLVGIRLMQSPRTALWGNRLGAGCMLLAIVYALHETGPEGGGVWVYLAAGGVAGFLFAQRVKMIQMPQTVAVFNGFGGGASALVAGTAMAAAAIPLGNADAALVYLFWFTAALALGIGTLTFTGSVVAALKLQGLVSQKPVSFGGQTAIFRLLLLIGAVLVVALAHLQAPVYRLVILVVFAVCGLLMALRIGGADMPVIISLLNSLSGVAAAVSGLAVDNFLLAGVGSLVGVAGIILTQLMCRAMNRSLGAVLAGFTPGRGVPADGGKPVTAAASPAAAGAADQGAAAAVERPSPVAATPDASSPAGSHAPAKTAAETAGRGDAEEAKPAPGEPADAVPAEAAPAAHGADPAALLRAAGKVVIVPGYGMALAQAQQSVRSLMDTLERDGKEVKVAIHPVAGRMPGHMNVLLAEVGVDYDKLIEMDVINPEFPQTDVVVVVGASDVINPAATTAEGTPIYGMPVLRADQARAVIVCNLDEKPGYSGVDNTLYEMDHVVTLWGDAAETVPGIVEDYVKSAG